MTPNKSDISEMTPDRTTVGSGWVSTQNGKTHHPERVNFRFNGGFVSSLNPERRSQADQSMTRSPVPISGDPGKFTENLTIRKTVPRSLSILNHRPVLRRRSAIAGIQR